MSNYDLFLLYSRSPLAPAALAPGDRYVITLKAVLTESPCRHNMHCAITSANNFSGQSVVISRISTVQLGLSVRKSNLNRPFICPILQAYFFVAIFATSSISCDIKRMAFLASSVTNANSLSMLRSGDQYDTKTSPLSASHVLKFRGTNRLVS